MRRAVWLLVSSVLASSAAANAAEICGNGKDDDTDPTQPGWGQADEGCYTPMQTGVCESPLSCMDTGWVSWTTGSLHYDVPADVAPKSPFGPTIGFRRFYTSMYAPATPTGSPAPVNRTPLGPRWQHNYMSWIDRSGTNAVLHTPQGEDVRATYAATDGTWNYFLAQPGHHYQWFRQRIGGANEYHVTTLTGVTMVYDNKGLLVEVWDRVAAPNTGRVLITWSTASTNKVIESVTDATGLRRLRFSYVGANLSAIDYQLQTASIWATHHTTSYAYANSTLSTVTIGGQLAQSNTYSAGYLVQIRDGDNRQLVTFKYAATTPGRTVSIDTPDGTVGFEYNTSRCGGNTSNSTKTALFFNRGSASSCTVDADCGAGLLCGGSTGIGATGTCFRAARCLTVDTTSSLVADVSPLGPPGECTGACAAVTKYMWNAALDMTAVKDAGGSHVSTIYNSDGLPTKMVFGDTDGEASTGTRWVAFYYPANLPPYPPRGRVTEIRRPSALALSGSCSPTATEPEGCAQTIYEYDPQSGEVAVEKVKGLTGYVAAPSPFTHVTTRTYDEHGRLTEVDGPLPGTDDVTAYSYYIWDAGQPKSFGFLYGSFDYVGGAQPWLSRLVQAYDVWGNVVDWQEPDSTRSCRTYSAARNVLIRTTEKMAGGPPSNTRCDTPDPSDLVEDYTWDTNLRLTSVKSAGGSCAYYEYDAKGRLARSKRRDDCTPASAGPREDYVYDAEGLLTAIDTYDAAGVVTRKRLATYYDSRQLQGLLNPVDTTKITSIAYDDRGVPKQISHAGNLGTTTLTVDNTYQLTKIERTRAGITDSWDLLRDPMSNITQVKDPDLREIKTIYDDQGLLVERIVPDQGSQQTFYNESGEVTRILRGPDPTSYTRDPFGRVTAVNLPWACGAPWTPEIAIKYDENAMCPSCKNLRGRVAEVRVTLLCDSNLPDKAFDQTTYYSYDAAGRIIAEYIRDDKNRIANQSYSWTKDGDLATVTMPSTAIIEWTHGSAASNADTDRVTAISRTSTPIIDHITWKPNGPVEQYDRRDTISGSPLRMKHAYDLAYQPTQIRLDAQNGTGPYYQLAVSSDAKGRVTKRDVYPSDPQLPGVFDSHYLYDDADRLLCESKIAAIACPTVAADVKNNLVGGLTGAGDRTTLLRPTAGSSGMTNTFTTKADGHRMLSVAQPPPLGTTTYQYNAKGQRIVEDNAALSTGNPPVNFDRRAITYDARDNVSSVSGFFRVGGAWHGYTMRNAFDVQNRRVFKAVEDTTTGLQQHWFFYYDPFGRLTEVRHIPNAAEVPVSTYTIYQLVWLDNLLVAYWQTDLPTGATTKRYVESDEAGRPVRMHAWSAGTNSQVVWAVDQDAWGFDKVVVGAGLFQPVVFPGQYRDVETASFLADGATVFRPALIHNGFRTYDPFTGTYLQIDPLVTKTWDEYTYAFGNPVGIVDPKGLKPVQEGRRNQNCTRVRTYRGDPDNGGVLTSDETFCHPLSEPLLGGLFPGLGSGGRPGIGGGVSGNIGGQRKEPAPKPPRNPAVCNSKLNALQAAIASSETAATTARRSIRNGVGAANGAVAACVFAYAIPGPGWAFAGACLLALYGASFPVADSDEDEALRDAARQKMDDARVTYMDCMYNL